jgi:hypothetical protein
LEAFNPMHGEDDSPLPSPVPPGVAVQVEVDGDDLDLPVEEPLPPPRAVKLKAPARRYASSEDASPPKYRRFLDGWWYIVIGLLAFGLALGLSLASR